MKVNIEQKETQVKTGMFKKVPAFAVVLTVDFSEEEKQIIKDRDLKDVVIMDRPAPFHRDQSDALAHIWHLHFYNILDEPNEYIVETPLEAKQYEARLIEQMKNTKEFLEENAGIDEGSTSFEL